jgi:hypothetical protein
VNPRVVQDVTAVPEPLERSCDGEVVWIETDPGVGDYNR